MNNCKDCKYFERETDQFHSNNYGYCECEKFQYDIPFKDVKELDLLCYMDCEGYSATLMVGENFGCIHYKEKK